MRTEIVQPDPIKIFSSTRRKGVRTSEPRFAPVIDWADTLCPQAWNIIGDNRSKAFGKHSVFYMGYERGEGDMACLLRLARFKAETERDDPFFGEGARFTLTYYGEKGFTGGFFQQWDGKYHRGCYTLDYTPGMFGKVVERFRVWAESGTYSHASIEIHLNQKTVWAKNP